MLDDEDIKISTLFDTENITLSDDKTIPLPSDPADSSGRKTTTTETETHTTRGRISLNIYQFDPFNASPSLQAKEDATHPIPACIHVQLNHTPQLIPAQVHTGSTHNTVKHPRDHNINFLHRLPEDTPPGNNFYIGDTLALPKPSTTTRIYFQNVNGITLANPGTWDMTCSHIRDMEVNIAMFAEHKLDTTQARVLKKLYDEPKRIFGLGAYSITAASTTIASPTMYKPGGVLLLANGGIKGRIQKTGSDALGHWAYMTLRQNMGPPLTAIVTYQVVDMDPKSSGLTTYAMQL